MHNILSHMGERIGHLVLLATFSRFVIWYARDAWLAQDEVENMLLIGPISALVLILMAGIAIRQIRLMIASGPRRADTAPVADAVETIRSRYGAVLSATFLGLYVASMPLIGFDVATALFVAAQMVLQGARNMLLIVFFSALVAILPVLAIEQLLSVPVPTTVLP